MRVRRLCAVLCWAGVVLSCVKDTGAAVGPEAEAGAAGGQMYDTAVNGASPRGVIVQHYAMHGM